MKNRRQMTAGAISAAIVCAFVFSPAVEAATRKRTTKRTAIKRAAAAASVTTTIPEIEAKPYTVTQNGLTVNVLMNPKICDGKPGKWFTISGLTSPDYLWSSRFRDDKSAKSSFTAKANDDGTAEFVGLCNVVYAGSPIDTWTITDKASGRIVTFNVKTILPPVDSTTTATLNPNVSGG
jgi:hypothetical protein